MPPRVSAIIPTLNGARTLPALLAALAQAQSQVPLEIIAIDSGSTDPTVDLLHAAGALVLDLGGRPFGHGSARNRAAAAAGGDVLLLLTQDVEPVGEAWLSALLEALESPVVAGAFGRQVPRGASLPERFLAETNYGASPRRITAADTRTFGPGATLFSNAFGVVTRAAWAATPFPDIVMSEDQAWALAVLRAGAELRYTPDAAVYHGHRFPLARVFRRNFDSGSSLQQIGLAGGAARAGLRYLLREAGWVAAQEGLAALPGVVGYEVVRMLGYQCGRVERVLPGALARRLGEAPRPRA